jgi:hypothetical protein
MNMVGKTVAVVENDSYYGVVRIYFTDGTYTIFTPCTAPGSEAFLVIDITIIGVD